MTWLRMRGVVAFGLFLLLAAPVEFNLAWLFDELNEALLRGVLYFFAVIVSIESWMRLQTNQQLSDRFGLFVLKWLVWIPILFFILDFMPKRFGGNLAALGTWRYQWHAAGIAFVGSLVTHIVIEFANRTSQDSLEEPDA